MPDSTSVVLAQLFFTGVQNRIHAWLNFMASVATVLHQILFYASLSWALIILLFHGLQSNSYEIQYFSFTF